MKKEEIFKAIMELPKLETNKPTSVVNNISVDDLMSAVDRFNKVPTYDELLKENKKQKEINKKAIEYIKSKENGKCIRNGIEKGAYTFVLDFDKAREFIWELLQILEDAR